MSLKARFEQPQESNSILEHVNTARARPFCQELIASFSAPESDRVNRKLIQGLMKRRDLLLFRAKQ
jgi:hypothetical protein